MRRHQTRLFWRVFSLDAALMSVVAALLLFSPVTISAPIARTEAIIVIAGFTVFLAANLLLLRRAFQPMHRLVDRMHAVDLLRPDQRLLVEHDDEVGQVVQAFNSMLDRLEHERRQAGRRLLEAQEAERRAIARDLHDEVGQLLTGVLLQLKGVAPHGDEHVAHAQAAVRKALDEVRRISRELRPESLDQLGLASALRELVTSFERMSGVGVRCRIASDIPKLDTAVELAAYRIVQESLTNVARHASASSVELTAEADGDARVIVVVRDDGIGISERATQSAGLRSMRERAVLIGAALSISAAADGGTQVRLAIPLGRARRTKREPGAHVDSP